MNIYWSKLALYVHNSIETGLIFRQISNYSSVNFVKLTSYLPICRILFLAVVAEELLSEAGVLIPGNHGILRVLARCPLIYREACSL